MEMLPWQLAEIGVFFSSLLQLKFISSNNFFFKCYNSHYHKDVVFLPCIGRNYSSLPHYLIIFHVSVLSEVMTGSYNNFFRMFNRDAQRDVTLEASWENGSPGCPLKTWRVCAGSRRKRNEIGVDCLDFSRKILYTSWHPQDNIVALATVNNLYIFQEKPN